MTFLWSDRAILLALYILVVLTFGGVAYEQVWKDRGIRCYVKQDTLFCPPGTTWKYTAQDRQWDAARGTYP